MVNTYEDSQISKLLISKAKGLKGEKSFTLNGGITITARFDKSGEVLLGKTFVRLPGQVILPYVKLNRMGKIRLIDSLQRK